MNKESNLSKVLLVCNLIGSNPFVDISSIKRDYSRISFDAYDKGSKLFYKINATINEDIIKINQIFNNKSNTKLNYCFTRLIDDIVVDNTWVEKITGETEEYITKYWNIDLNNNYATIVDNKFILKRVK